MKRKLEYPRFFIPVADVSRHLQQPNVPVCHGTIQFLGSWPTPQPATAETELLPITATYGTKWNGFYLSYDLTAGVAASFFGRTRLEENDLKGLRLRYTDDRLNAEVHQEVSVEQLFERLRIPENRVPADFFISVPGGEHLSFSAPLKALMFRPEARESLLALLDDPDIRNEVVLLLGAVGNEATVPQLIARYPRGPIDAADHNAVLTRVCFSYALCWLTGQSIDRSRAGTDEDEKNAEKWETWWAAGRETFRVPKVKPYASWVPTYPVLADEHVARIQSMFAEPGCQWFEWE